MAGKFVLTQDDAGQFRFTLVASNGDVIASSESYSQKGAAQNGIDAVRQYAVDAVVDDQTPRA